MDVLSRADSPKDSQALVARGRIAWGQLKDEAPRSRALSRGPGAKARERRERSKNERRQWWLEVGQALMIGKRASATGHAYYAWIKANGFDDMPRSARKDAIWFASNIGVLGELPVGMASPGTIRQWANKQAALSSVFPDAKHASESVSRASPHILGGPLQAKVLAKQLQDAPDITVDMQRVAGLLLEAAMNMQQGVDLLREIACAIQQPQVTVTSRRP